MRVRGGQPTELTAELRGGEEAGVADVPGQAAVTPSLDEFARQHRPLLLSLARKLCRDRFDADDLVQDVLERALKGLPRLPSGANVRSWLARIMHNRFIDLVRRRDTQPGMESYEDDQAAEAPASMPAWERITIEDVQARILELSPELREVYECHAVLNLSYTEAAARLSIPTGTVGTRLLRARRRLRELLLPGGEDDHD